MTGPRKGKQVWHGHIFRDVGRYGPTRMVFKVVEGDAPRMFQ